MGKKLLSWKAGTVNALLMGWGSCFQPVVEDSVLLLLPFPKKELIWKFRGKQWKSGKHGVTQKNGRATSLPPAPAWTESILSPLYGFKNIKVFFLVPRKLFFLLSYRIWNWISVSVLTGIWNSLSFQVSIYIPTSWVFAIRVSNWINIEKC